MYLDTFKNTWMLLENPFSFPESKRTLPALCVSLIQADASYFRIDLPNSGMVILDKPLDYETKTQLQVVIFAVVRSTCYSHMCWLAITRHLCAGKESELRENSLSCHSCCLNQQETNTKEKYSTSATVTVNVLDGDDQYPQFQPCAPVYEDGDHNICTNPVYSVNITEAEEVCGDILMYRWLI